MTERIGILGGTFDPIHNGHLFAACTVRRALELDRLMLVVAGDPWQKTGTVQASARDRLSLVEHAVIGVEGVAASALEVDRTGPTYTVDTLETLHAPDRHLFLILGADAAAGLPTWRDPERIRKLATLVIVERGDTPVARTITEAAVHVPMLRLDISSSDIRRRIAQGEPIDGLVPESVVHRIAELGLYTGGEW
ncbi:MAG: nicotinate-nucleotide adenylyltransferase [Acidimicrobiia bacterium]